MSSKSSRYLPALAAGIIAILGFAGFAVASHSWGNFHWARTTNPFTLKLGDNVDSKWDVYLATTSNDWSTSSVLDTNVVAGSTTPKACKATSGRVEVCNSKYGKNGWLGVATIWASVDHITQGTVKVNDSYFNTSTYNTPAWRNLVMCQEVGHTFGLDHQDENFSNPNLGTCMDYTSDPDGPPSNEHPNQHDYDQLELIYAHLDTTTTIKAGEKGAVQNRADGESPSEWGRSLRVDSHGRTSIYEQDLGKGHKVFTFVFWAE